MVTVIGIVLTSHEYPDEASQCAYSSSRSATKAQANKTGDGNLSECELMLVCILLDIGCPSVTSSMLLVLQCVIVQAS